MDMPEREAGGAARPDRSCRPTMVWMVDVGIRDLVGHGLNYARALYRSAQDLCLGFRILGCRGISPEVSREIPLEPVFRRHGSSAFLRCSLPGSRRFVAFYNCIRWNIEFHADLERALRGRAGRDSVVFMPSLDDRHLPAWAWWLRGRSPADAPETVLFLRYHPRSANLPAFLLRFCFRALEWVARGRRLRFVTDSDLLAREYARFTRRPVEVFPIVHTAESAALASFRGEKPPRKGVCFVSLGEARDDKGFPILAQAIRILRDRGLLGRGIEFAIQANTRPSYKKTLDAVRDLQRMGGTEVRVIEDPLNVDAYYRLLDSADVVLVPYCRSVYQATTSGPFTEALAAAKPVVVTDGTWMSHQLSRFGGGVTFRDGDAEDLARAIVEAAARIEALRAQARATQPSWVEWHNPATFLRMLLGEDRGATSARS